MNDIEKARRYFEKKLRAFSDYFGAEKYPCEIKVTKIALDLIDKDTPGEPTSYMHSAPRYRCPRCRKSVAFSEKSAKYPHCQWCGQKLDWKGKETYE